MFGGSLAETGGKRKKAEEVFSAVSLHRILWDISCLLPGLCSFSFTLGTLESLRHLLFLQIVCLWWFWVGFLPIVAELTGDTYLSFPPVKHMRVSPTADSVGCQCWDWDLFFASLIKASDLDLLSDSACICECREWAKQMKRKSSCSVVLSYQEYKTCKGEISGVRVCLLYLK